MKLFYLFSIAAFCTKLRQKFKDAEPKIIVPVVRSSPPQIQYSEMKRTCKLYATKYKEIVHCHKNNIFFLDQ